MADLSKLNQPHQSPSAQDLALIRDYLVYHYDGLGLDMDGSCVRNEFIHHEVAQRLLVQNLPFDERQLAHVTVSWDWWMKNLGSGQAGIWEKFKAEFPAFSMPKDDFVSEWGARYEQEVMLLQTGRGEKKFQKFQRSGLDELVDIFRQANKPHVVYSVSTRRMLDANQKAIGLDPVVSISGNDISAVGAQPKPDPTGWFMAFDAKKTAGFSGVRPSVPTYLMLDRVSSDGMPMIVHGAQSMPVQNSIRIDAEPKRLLILEDTAKGVRCAKNFGAAVIHVHFKGDQPDRLSDYSVRDDEHVLNGFLAEARRWSLEQTARLGHGQRRIVSNKPE